MPMKKLWIKKFGLHKEAEESDNKHYSSMSNKERLSIMQFLRNQYWKLKKGDSGNGDTKRLRGSVKIIKQA